MALKDNMRGRPLSEMLTSSDKDVLPKKYANYFMEYSSVNNIINYPKDGKKMNKKPYAQKGQVIGQVLTVMVVFCLMCFHTNSMAAPIPQEDPPFETIPIPQEVHVWNLDSNHVDARSSKNPKLDLSMAGLADAEDPAAQNALIQSQSLTMSGGRVQVQIVIPADGLPDAITVVNEAGGEVTKTSIDGTLIQGWLPIGKLEAVAAHDEVFFIRRPAEAVLLENEQVGSYTTEGLAAMNGASWHSAGYLGAGVKIGIIDLGFLGYPNLLGSDLPSAVSVKNFVDGEIRSASQRHHRARHCLCRGRLRCCTGGRALLRKSQHEFGPGSGCDLDEGYEPSRYHLHFTWLVQHHAG